MGGVGEDDVVSGSLEGYFTADEDGMTQAASACMQVNKMNFNCVHIQSKNFYTVKVLQARPTQNYSSTQLFRHCSKSDILLHPVSEKTCF